MKNYRNKLDYLAVKKYLYALLALLAYHWKIGYKFVSFIGLGPDRGR